MFWVFFISGKINWIALHRSQSSSYATRIIHEWVITEHWHNSSLLDSSYCYLGWSRVSTKDVKNPPLTTLWQRSTLTATITQNVSWEKIHTMTAVSLESTVKRETPICPVLPMRGDSVTRSWSMWGKYFVFVSLVHPDVFFKSIYVFIRCAMRIRFSRACLATWSVAKILSFGPVCCWRATPTDGRWLTR